LDVRFGSSAGTEVTATFDEGLGEGQAQNVKWRLAFWRYLVEESASRPIAGVGFGAPASFEWRDLVYDRRVGDGQPQDFTGPHNSFVNMLYRTGLPGLLALLAIMFVAVRGLLRRTRAADGEDRALGIWLLGGLALVTCVSLFFVSLETPFLAIFFWGLLGLALLAPDPSPSARDRIG
jgi:O-antigen ligase